MKYLIITLLLITKPIYAIDTLLTKSGDVGEVRIVYRITELTKHDNGGYTFVAVSNDLPSAMGFKLSLEGPWSLAKRHHEIIEKARKPVRFNRRKGQPRASFDASRTYLLEWEENKALVSITSVHELTDNLEDYLNKTLLIGRSETIIGEFTAEASGDTNNYSLHYNHMPKVRSGEEPGRFIQDIIVDLPYGIMTVYYSVKYGYGASFYSSGAAAREHFLKNQNNANKSMDTNL